MEWNETTKYWFYNVQTLVLCRTRLNVNSRFFQGKKKWKSTELLSNKACLTDWLTDWLGTFFNRLELVTSLLVQLSIINGRQSPLFSLVIQGSDKQQKLIIIWISIEFIHESKPITPFNLITDFFLSPLLLLLMLLLLFRFIQTIDSWIFLWREKNYVIVCLISFLRTHFIHTSMYGWVKNFQQK